MVTWLFLQAEKYQRVYIKMGKTGNGNTMIIVVQKINQKNNLEMHFKPSALMKFIFFEIFFTMLPILVE